MINNGTFFFLRRTTNNPEEDNTNTVAMTIPVKTHLFNPKMVDVVVDTALELAAGVADVPDDPDEGVVPLDDAFAAAAAFASAAT